MIGALPDKFTPDVLAKIQRQAALPFTPHGWAVVSTDPRFQNPNIVQVDPNAKTGVMYKYTVTGPCRINFLFVLITFISSGVGSDRLHQIASEEASHGNVSEPR